jgi:transposase
MTQRNKPKPAHVFGIDIGKNIFHVVSIDATGLPVQKVRFKRETLLQFFERAEPALIGMESCPGSQWLARKLHAVGHEVRIMPAQFVKPYVKTNKSDIIDAEAIAEAVTRPTMRFVAVRSTEQVDLQALHRMRSQLVSTKTRLINQMRAFCLEYGIAMRQGAGVFKLDIRRVIDDEANDLSATMRRLLTDMTGDLQHIDMRIKAVTTEIDAMAARDDVARRLMTIPGIGTLGATALLSAMGDAGRFRKARDLAAWLGLVPHQHSTGGKPNLLSISKRGNGYLRRLIIAGARSCYAHLDRKRDRLGSWMDALGSRMHPNKAIVAVAAKIARIAWVIITKPGALYDRRDPSFA